MINMELMRKRLEKRGGIFQQDRMIKDKRESLAKAIDFSYQGAKVVSSDGIIAKALINPSAVKQDYDEKTISIDFDYRYSIGTVFEWLNTGTKWLIYLQDLTELAYFKGDARRCNYAISWRDEENNIQSTYIALTGPSEKQINSTSFGNTSMDLPNYSLHFYMPNNENTTKYFHRYTKFYLQGSSICWQITSIDNISMPGILEIYATEHYANEHEDDIQQGLVGELIVDPIDPNGPMTDEQIIKGPTFIQPKTSYTYVYEGTSPGAWSILPGPKDTWFAGAQIKLSDMDSSHVTIKWDSPYSGQFILCYNDAVQKTVVVESLF